MSTFAPTRLPESTKKDMCRQLLAEFGATDVKDNGHGELTVRCVMPWHNDRNPSAQLNYIKLVYNCWSCQSSGGLLWLISTAGGGGSKSAHEWVESATGFSDGDFDLVTLLDLLEALSEPDQRRKEPIPKFSERALDPWMLIHPWLTDPISEGGRGIPEENVIALKAGYAEKYPMGEDEHGVMQTSERIVVPHFWRDKLVGWQSRRIYDDGTPKYLSTPSFPRDRTIFNHDPSRRVRVVVESPMSVLRHRHHLPIEATFGSEITDTQVRAMADADLVVAWPDPDKAGRWSMLGRKSEDGKSDVPGLIERMERYTELRIVQTDWSVDPADLSDDIVSDLVDAAVPASVWEPPTQLRCVDCGQVHTGECE